MAHKPIAVIGDFHVAQKIWESYAAITGDSELAAKEIAQEIVAANVGSVILAGDVFDSSTPPPEVVEIFRKWAQSLHSLNIKVYAIQGNHDKRTSPWCHAVTGTVVPIGDGRIHTIEGLRVRGLDYASRDSIARSLAEIGASGEPSDFIVLHQAAKQFLSFENAWNLDLEWVPAICGDVVMGDIHQPWVHPLDAKRTAFYTGAPTARCIDEATARKTFMIREPQGKWNHVGVRSRAIAAFGISAGTQEAATAGIIEFLEAARDPKVACGLTPVVQVNFDDTAPGAPTVLTEVLKSRGLDAFVISNFLGSRKSGVRYDPTQALSEVPGIQTFVGGFVDSEEDPRTHGLLLDLLDGTQGKDGITAKIQNARQRFLQETK